VKRRYEVDLLSLPPAMTLTNLRHPTPHDQDALAELMLDAYRGTIDFDDEGIEEAQTEVTDYFASHPVLDASTVISAEQTLLSACLVSHHRESELPLIAYLMTRAETKRQGYARAALTASLRWLTLLGHRRAEAYITAGNIASEELCLSLGFKPVQTKP